MKSLDSIMYILGAIGTVFGGFWLISIILYGDVPNYVKQSDLLFLGGVLILFYYTSVKDKS